MVSDLIRFVYPPGYGECQTPMLVLGHRKKGQEMLFQIGTFRQITDPVVVARAKRLGSSLDYIEYRLDGGYYQVAAFV